MSKKSGILGAHMSIAGGVSNAPKRGRAIGCDSIQIFTKSPNQWTGPPITAEEAGRFRENMAKYEIAAAIAHDTYLINLASPKDELWEKSIDAFADELARTELLGLPCLVMHPGSHTGEGEKWGIRRVIEGISEALKRSGTKSVKVAVETTAGQGTNLGYSFEQIAEIVEGLPAERAGVCYDTCHTFVAGYDIRTRKAYRETMRLFDEIVGIDRLLAIHLNDAKKELGSRIDRHERIGKGLIGLDGIMNIITDPRFAHLPMVLEVPGGEKAFAEDLKVIRAALEGG